MDKSVSKYVRSTLNLEGSLQIGLRNLKHSDLVFTETYNNVTAYQDLYYFLRPLVFHWNPIHFPQLVTHVNKTCQTQNPVSQPCHKTTL